MSLKKSPLKDKPLRQPGQSVQEELDKILEDKLLPYVVASAFLLSLAVQQWIAHLNQTPPQPIFATVLAILAIGYTTYLFSTYKKTIRNLKQGRDGEKAVGQFLEILREDGCVVFHDIIGNGFNIDHVVISEKGIYCIETKTWSKPTSGSPMIHFDGSTLKVDSIGDKSEVLTQINSASKWLQSTLSESTGKTYDVNPVVLFPGWYINSKQHSKIWVLEPKALRAFIAKQNPSIKTEDKKLAAFHLSRYIRSLH